MPGITLTDKLLTYEAFPVERVGARYCEPFSVPLQSICAIAISPRLEGDDETLYVLIVDRERRIFPMPYEVVPTGGMDRLEKRFELSSVFHELENFTYNDHMYARYDKIIYPEHLYGEALFKDNYKMKIRRFFWFFFSNRFIGDLRNDI